MQGDQSKQIVENPMRTKQVGEAEDFRVMDIDGGYTPEFNDTVKQMVLKKQRTQTL